MFFKIKITICCLLMITIPLVFGCTEKSVVGLNEFESKGYVIEEYEYSDGMLAVSNGEENKKKRWGFIDKDGVLKIQLKYSLCMPFADGLARVFTDEGEVQRCYYIDNEGNKVIERVGGKNLIMGDVFKDDYAVVSLEGTSGNHVINKRGEIYLFPTEENYRYKNLGAGTFERYLSDNVQNPQGVIDINGEIKYTGNYMFADITNTEVSFYTIDSISYGLLDYKSFEPINKPIYSKITGFVSSAAIVAKKDDSVNIIDSKGDLVADLSQDYKNIDIELLYEFADGVTALNFTDGVGATIIDINGKMIAETGYDEIYMFREGIAACKKNGKFGYVNSEGLEILSPTYEFVTNIDGNVGFVKDRGKSYRFLAYH